MAVTQADLAVQMLAQLRVLDPSVSAEVGTPERKILDTVAQALSDAQVDLTALSGALDIDSKVGSNLDKFLALFGFGRQQGALATGFVEFGREEATPSNLPIRIPVGTQITIPASDIDGQPVNSIYETTFEVTLEAGQLSVVAPVQALVAGSAGNLEAGRFFSFAGAYIFGITKIYNDTPITGGTDQEDDDQLKTRFKNTVFRNLAGTQDQYMALAVSTAFTTKVNVVGPVSRYREYIQVPELDDDSSYNVDGQGPAEEGDGLDKEWTTALSTIPYSKHTYENLPTFVSNGQTGTQAIFWRDGIDWRMNTEPLDKDRGDAHRLFISDTHLGPDPTSVEATYQPNITFLNVYEGSDEAIQYVRPKDVVLFEHSYMSTASRNDYMHNVMNAVDVFVDGGNNVVANTVVPSPGAVFTNAFVSAPAESKYYLENYRRVGFPDVRPTVGNLFIPLFWQPVTSLPDQITVSTSTDTSIFFLNEHYFLVEDITELYGTVRARNGIEWIASAHGALSNSDDARTGLRLTDFPTGTSVEINGYMFDRNVVDLQSTYESQKQVTTDILAHRARIRHFKLDITVMYEGGYNTTLVNEEIYGAVDRYFKRQYFGSIIQLSDLLSVIHSVPGVDNVRWSSDVRGSDAARVYETNIDGTNRDSLSYDNDFFLKDDELPALAEAIDPSDQYGVQPGLIIRARAQNTWFKS